MSTSQVFLILGVILLALAIAFLVYATSKRGGTSTREAEWQQQHDLFQGDEGRHARLRAESAQADGRWQPKVAGGVDNPYEEPPILEKRDVFEGAPFANPDSAHAQDAAHGDAHVHSGVNVGALPEPIAFDDGDDVPSEDPFVEAPAVADEAAVAAGAAVSAEAVTATSEAVPSHDAVPPRDGAGDAESAGAAELTAQTPHWAQNVAASQPVDAPFEGEPVLAEEETEFVTYDGPQAAADSAFDAAPVPDAGPEAEDGPELDEGPLAESVSSRDIDPVQPSREAAELEAAEFADAADEDGSAWQQEAEVADASDAWVAAPVPPVTPQAASRWGLSEEEMQATAPAPTLVQPVVEQEPEAAADEIEAEAQTVAVAQEPGTPVLEETETETETVAVTQPWAAPAVNETQTETQPETEIEAVAVADAHESDEPLAEEIAAVTTETEFVAETDGQALDAAAPDAMLAPEPLVTAASESIAEEQIAEEPASETSSAAPHTDEVVEEHDAKGAVFGHDGHRLVSTYEEVVDGGYGVGSAAPVFDGAQPYGHPIKGRRETQEYFTPDSPWYGGVEANVWFYDEDAARRFGFHG